MRRPVVSSFARRSCSSKKRASPTSSFRRLPTSTRWADARGHARKCSNPESVNNRLTAWRQVLKHAWDKGLMSGEDYHRDASPAPSSTQSGRNGVIVPQERPMTVKVGNDVVDRRLLAAGVPRLSSHDRCATSTTILAGLLDLFKTMDWAGHKGEYDSRLRRRGERPRAGDRAEAHSTLRRRSSLRRASVERPRVVPGRSLLSR